MKKFAKSKRNKPSKKAEKSKSLNINVKKEAPLKKEYTEFYLIDGLHEALTRAGIHVNRDGWKEDGNSIPPNDNCQWLDVPLKDKEGNIYTVHFYFTNDSKVLSSLQIFKSEIKTTYTTPSHVAGDYCTGLK